MFLKESERIAIEANERLAVRRATGGVVKKDNKNESGAFIEEVVDEIMSSVSPDFKILKPAGTNSIKAKNNHLEIISQIGSHKAMLVHSPKKTWFVVRDTNIGGTENFSVDLHVIENKQLLVAVEAKYYHENCYCARACDDFAHIKIVNPSCKCIIVAGLQDGTDEGMNYRIHQEYVCPNTGIRVNPFDGMILIMSDNIDSEKQCTRDHNQPLLSLDTPFVFSALLICKFMEKLHQWRNEAVLKKIA
jgi:hypothetical protein